MIPHLFRLSTTTFNFNYTVNRSDNLSTLVGSVPTLAERAGDFSLANNIIYDPTTHQPFAGNTIPASIVNQNTIALGLLKFFPLPNQIGSCSATRTGGCSAQNFGCLDHSEGHGVSASLSWTHTFAPRVFNVASVNFNRNRSNALPFFANGTDVAGALGILGTSNNPLNYGPPNLTFTNFAGLTDGSASLTRIQSTSFHEAFTWMRGKHSLSFGGL